MSPTSRPPACPATASTPGNRGAYCCRRPLGDRTEFLTVSFWDDLDVVRRFAGDDIDVAVFYPEDDRFLTARDLVAYHYEVASPATAP